MKDTDQELRNELNGSAVMNMSPARTSRIKNDTKDTYFKLLKSGMFWEFHPELIGEWEKDKSKWSKIYKKMKDNIKEHSIEGVCFGYSGTGTGRAL